MKRKYIAYLLLALGALLPCVANAQQQQAATTWLTTQEKTALFAKQPGLLQFSAAENDNVPTITVDDAKKFQSIDGFGFAVTGGSAELLMHMKASARAALLKEVFSTEGDGIGVSYIRLSIGSSDMNDPQVYSYDDVPPGQTDPSLAKFTLAPDRRYVIPVMKEILAINPHIQILGSPWSAPAWMKTNDDVRGGSLKPEYYEAYANYFVKYIQGMKVEGIAIDAITIQNEPLNPKNTPSMAMFGKQQDEFIKAALGPAFREAGIKAKILLYDHNPDVLSYALNILKDPAASKYVDGTAYHLYGGEASELTKVHDAFPNKNLYLTEQSITEPPNMTIIDIAEPVQRVLIGATRNWSRNVLLWNLAANSNNGPHTDNGGCTECSGALTIEGNHVTRLLAYYADAHFSKFVRPGSVRVGSNILEQLNNVAFVTPAGKIVLVVSSTGNFEKTFHVRYHGRMFTASLPPGAVATYVW